MSAEDLLSTAQDTVPNGQLVSSSLSVPEHSLHFGHVSSVNNGYDMSAVGADLSYGHYGMQHQGDILNPATFPLPHPSLVTTQRKTERRRPPGKKNTNEPHIPRPRNAFILFRSAFIEQKNGKELASKQQNLSRIAAMVWKSMSATEQDPWYKLAAEEKQMHYAANPGYTFQPSGRGENNKKKTRKPTTEPAVEETSCKRIADLIISGVNGEDLITAAKSEGVAPYQRQGDKKRRNPTVSDPTLGDDQLLMPEPNPLGEDSEGSDQFGGSPGTYNYA